MPFVLHDPLYGHAAIFFAHSAAAKYAADVTWGPSSIDVPHSSPLNGPAKVWFHLPSVSLQRAAKWCNQSNVQFMGEWRNSSDASPSGFGFHVSHFSRYRYVDSDDESNNDNGGGGGNDGNGNGNGKRKDRDPQTVESDTQQQAVGHSPHVSEQVSLRHARLLRAGSTPARLRASRSRSSSHVPPNAPFSDTPQQPAFVRPPVPPPTPATASRPRMSTREILDLDDTDVDADIDDVDPDISLEEPDVDPKVEPVPESAEPGPRPSFDMGAFPGLPPTGAFRTSNEPISMRFRSHRTLSFLDPDEPSLDTENALGERTEGLESQGVTPFWKSEPRLEASNLHQLRDAMFPQYNTTEAKREPRMHDMDMMDMASPTMNAPRSVKFVDPWYSSDSDDEDVEQPTSRESNDSAGEDDGLPTLLSDRLMDAALPFPTLEFSVVSNRCSNFVDINLAQGRTFRAAFSQTGELLASRYDLLRGFTLNVSNVGIYSLAAPRFAFSSLLASHCALWYNCISSEHGVGFADTAASNLDSNHRIVRVPSWDPVFRYSDQVVSGLKTAIECCECIETNPDDANASHARIIFEALFALYCCDSIAEAPITNENSTNLLEHVTDWVRHSAGVALDGDDKQSSGLMKSVMAMTLGDVEAAVDNAVELGHFRLAMLIARSLDGLKSDLRADAESQLFAYNFRNNLASEMSSSTSENSVGGDEGWDHILTTSQDLNTEVTVEERMILLLLAGRVGPVARYLNVSWYRVFVMELLYGAGSSNLSQPQRVAAAINVVPLSGISTLAPHKMTNDEDTAYKVLQLYATSDAGDSLPKDLFCNSGIGVSHRPMDYRFTWTLHQVLRGLIPESSSQLAGFHLAAGLAEQLDANDMPLWAFYVLCSGGSSDSALKERLIRSWPRIREGVVELVANRDGTLATDVGSEQKLARDDDDDREVTDSEASREANRMEPEDFLRDVLAVPDAWLSEAKAVAARECGNQLEECEHWIACGDERGAAEAQNLLLKDLVPNAIISNDAKQLKRICELLEHLEVMDCVPNWGSNGGLILGYLRYVLGVPILREVDLTSLKELGGKVVQYFKRVSTDAEKCAAKKIADGIVTAQRALMILVSVTEREGWFLSVLSDLEELPCTRAVRLRITGEYMVANTKGWPSAQRMASAYPAYRKYLEIGMESRTEEDRMKDEDGEQVDGVMTA